MKASLVDSIIILEIVRKGEETAFSKTYERMLASYEGLLRLLTPGKG